MPAKQAVFNFKLETELRDEFMAAAEKSHRPAAQIVRELMREFIRRQNEETAYEEFVRRKVQAARQSAREGRVISSSDIERDFEQRKAAVRKA